MGSWTNCGSCARVFGVALILSLAPLQIGWGFDLQEEERRFLIFDTNRDGKINQEEYQINKVQAFLQRRPGETTRVVQITAAETQLKKEAFDMFDINGDGVLSGGEIISAQVLQFTAVDTNADGSIDRTEFHALVVKLMQ